MGHDFVLCFISDDLTGCNLGWVEKAMEMDFRFTISVNANRLDQFPFLAAVDVRQFFVDGFEISNHSLSHATYGMIRCEDGQTPPACDLHYGNLLGYFDFTSSFSDSSESMPYFRNEIRKEPITDLVPPLTIEDLKTFVYPGHCYSVAIVEALHEWGYLGARDGPWAPGFTDYTTPPANSWDGGISFFRVPIAFDSSDVFGDHSADPPVHFTRQEFEAATLPIIEEMRESGGIMAITAHHYGDDDSCHSNEWGYGSGGMTDTELEWLVELVRNNNGIVMTFSDALEFYQKRAFLHEVDGDLIWIHASGAAVPKTPVAASFVVKSFPNPFNPIIQFHFQIMEENSISLAIYDLIGRKRKDLHRGTLGRGWHTLVWDGKDDLGLDAPSGVYLAVLKVSDQKVVRKISLVR